MSQRHLKILRLQYLIFFFEIIQYLILTSESGQKNAAYILLCQKRKKKEKDNETLLHDDAITCYSCLVIFSNLYNRQKAQIKTYQWDSSCF